MPMHAGLTLTPEQHRQLGVDLFNHVWTLLGTTDRTLEQDDEMINSAHASRHHWSQVGTNANIARGEWQISRVYCVLERAEPALHHAGRCLAYCESDPDSLEDWDLPFAYEALARAHAVAGNSAESRRFAARAQELGERIEDEEDRELLARDLATLS
jgi:hypothetical protein